MPNYVRQPLNNRPVFVIVKTMPAHPILVEESAVLRHAIETVQARRPFTIDAMVLLPDHFHAIWTLPIEDEDFSSRISVIKTLFSKKIGRDGEFVTSSRTARRERGVWQRRFYDHIIRDECDFQNHVDYIHINPVKRGYVQRVQDWPHSSFHRYVRQGILPIDWAGGDATEVDAGE